MTFSPLIAGTVPHHNKYSSRNGQPVVWVLQHHWAGIGGGDARLLDPNQQASATYIIYSDGRIMGQVPEEFRPWTSGSFEADAPAITIEVQNISGQVNGDDSHPDSWQISKAALDAIERLLADVATRYGWGGISEGNYQGHRQWYQTACPGGFIWARMGQIRNMAQAFYSGGGLVPSSVPATPPVEGKSIWQLADEVMAGLHGTGADRQESLGGSYDEVQAEVNRRFGVGSPASNEPAGSPASIAQLADEVIAGVHGNGDDRRASLGDSYDAVQAEINRRLGGGGVAPQGPNISQLADAVMRGEYGDGEERRARLDDVYDAVQNEINRRFGVGPVAAPAPSAPAAPQGPDINALVEATLRGEFGNGDDRRAALGGNYDAVQAEINNRLGGAPAAPQGPDINALVEATIRGDFGNGDDRVNALGPNYQAVQDEINRRYS
jgi:N-acetylmuramoyl-L-alanine amidase